MDLEQILVSIGSAIFIAVISSWVTVRLALRRFYSEKWWERKAEAYSEIIEALYDVYNSIVTTLKRGDWGAKQVPEEIREIISERSEEGYYKIVRAVGIGAFIISDEAVDELTKLHRKTNMPLGEILYDSLDERRSLYKQAIDTIRELAKKDLKVK